MLFWTYALYSKSADEIYVGQTNNLSFRFKQHNGFGKFKSWTTRNKPWMLFHFEIFTSRRESVAREKQLKSGRGRAFLRSLLKGE